MMKLKNLYKLAWVLPIAFGLTFMAYTPNTSETNQDNKEQEKKEEKVITVNELIHDFGTIKEANGEVTTVFTVTNNMETPILLSDVRVSCGCSNTTWTKEPIEPGKTGKVTVNFNPAGLYGPFEKYVNIVTTGTPNRISLRIKGIIE
ncbi:MAG: DUF1573 domain-containing protein [Bacteroidales bacterium]|nr:DUF1573 domain-containing protein [Bacteroidales bacterium]